MPKFPDASDDARAKSLRDNDTAEETAEEDDEGEEEDGEEDDEDDDDSDAADDEEGGDEAGTEDDGGLTLEDDLTSSILVDATAGPTDIVGEDDGAGAEGEQDDDDEEEENDGEDAGGIEGGTDGSGAKEAGKDEASGRESSLPPPRPMPPPLPALPSKSAAGLAAAASAVPVESAEAAAATPTVADAESAAPARKKRRKRVFTICLTSCKYEVVRRSARRVGFREVEEDEEWNVYWTDTYVTIDKVCAMKKFQKINHFPGMSEICRKDSLGRNLVRMQKLFPKEFNVAPKTWILPADWSDLQSYARSKKHKTYILKPEASCQGKGIWCTKNPKDIKPGEHQICQLYLTKPFLIDGYKFDLRVYVLVTSCDPLRIFVFKEGLARFTTVKYKDPTNGNVENIYMHLTNYAVQKGRKEFVRNDEEGGTKRRISTINRWLESNNYDVEKLWSDIDDVIIKTVMSAHYVVKHNYRTCFPNHVKGSACFEILGFDIIIDRKLKPLVLEVNHSPSFTTDSRLDREIKDALITDTLNLINVGAVDRKKAQEEERRKIQERLFQRNSKKESKSEIYQREREDLEREAAKFLESQEQYEAQHMGNYRRIFPCQGSEQRYGRYLAQAGFLYQETAATRARADCARQQREEINRKAAAVAAATPGRRRNNNSQQQLGARPESPDRPPLRRPQQTRSRVQQQQRQAAPMARKEQQQPPIDTLTPQPIVDEDEIERLSGLMQRDSLVRGLGIVEQVHRLLHCTPGTVASLPAATDQAAAAANQLSSLQQQQPISGGLLAANSRYLDELSNRLGVAMVTGSYGLGAAVARAGQQLQQQQQQQPVSLGLNRPWMRPGSKQHQQQQQRLAFGQRGGGGGEFGIVGSAGKTRSFGPARLGQYGSGTRPPHPGSSKARQQQQQQQQLHHYQHPLSIGGGMGAASTGSLSVMSAPVAGRPTGAAASDPHQHLLLLGGGGGGGTAADGGSAAMEFGRVAKRLQKQQQQQQQQQQRRGRAAGDLLDSPVILLR